MKLDPPYNTGNDFVYADDYADSIGSYLELTGQTDERGKLSTNSESAGRFHSNWLNMMHPRLKLERNLLSDDGVIFISISDEEAPSLRLICDEVFGENNFIWSIIWNSTKSVTNTALISVSYTYNYVYTRHIRHFTTNRGDSDSRKPMRDFLTPIMTLAARGRLIRSKLAVKDLTNYMKSLTLRPDSATGQNQATAGKMISNAFNSCWLTVESVCLMSRVKD